MARKEKQDPRVRVRRSKNRSLRSNRVVRVDFEKKVVLTKMIIDREMFCNILDAIKDVVEELPNIDGTTAINILKEMRFVGCFDHNFRVKTYPELEELFYELYERANT